MTSSGNDVISVVLGNTDFITESLCYKLGLRGRKYVEVNQTEVEIMLLVA